MKTISSRLTSQGQISVPAEIRRKLGIGPGSVIEWEERNGKVFVRRSGRYSSEDIHRSLFGSVPNKASISDMKEGIREHIRKKHASD
ncbi:MAG: AbrB/MazE/SpoVT family DNA-binding domain-containing protein [Acidobacteria bacterium]|nr:AbrB/MazE/SpoVT family DNA-binding domain-containing protein [Acidobacteriota bacterium]